MHSYSHEAEVKRDYTKLFALVTDVMKLTFAGVSWRSKPTVDGNNERHGGERRGTQNPVNLTVLGHVYHVCLWSNSPYEINQRNVQHETRVCPRL